jgi:replicative DNA helicase
MTRIQPHNIEIEEQVLGIILNEPKAFVTAVNIINANCFYKNEHQTVFNAFTSLYSQAKPIDLVSVTTYLRNNNHLDNVGGNFFLMELMERAGTYSSFEYFCHTLLELSERREGIEKSAKLIDSLYDLSTDLDENMVIANEVVLSLSNEVSNVGGVQLSTALLEMIREQENELRGEFSGCKSKYVDLDRVIVGFKNQQVAVLAGRPGMGKTTFGINIAYRLAKYDKTPVGFFSLEMSSVELTKKFAAIESQICNSRMTMLPEKQVLDYFSAIQSVGDLPIFIDDKPGASIDEIRARAITMKRKHDVKLIVIDYLQLITTKSRSGNREQEISEISRKVKLLAK